MVNRNGKYTLLGDFYYSGGLEKILGKDAGKLKQAYAVESSIAVAKKKGFHVQEQKTKTGIRLVMTGR